VIAAGPVVVNRERVQALDLVPPRSRSYKIWETSFLKITSDRVVENTKIHNRFGILAFSTGFPLHFENFGLKGECVGGGIFFRDTKLAVSWSGVQFFKRNLIRIQKSNKKIDFFPFAQ